MSKNLPAGWAKTQLGDCLLSIVGGGTPSRRVAAYFKGTIPWFTVKDMKSPKPSDAEEHISAEAIANSAANVVPPNTLICATRISLGRAIRPTVKCAINQDLKALIVGAGVDSDFLLYWILANEQEIQKKGTGTTVSGIRLETLRSLPLLLPPSLEQSRIVGKLEELLSDLDAGVAELRKAQSKLLQYRKSLLKSAVEGRLTAEWRVSSDKPKETGEELLKRILSERRTRWEKMQRAKFAKQKKTLPKGWQAKYSEPISPDSKRLTALPPGWTWATLDQLSFVVRGASPRPAGDPRYFGGDIPWITVGSLTADERMHLESVDLFVTSAGRDASRYIEPNTLLLTNSGATLGVPKITRIGGCINDGSVALIDMDEQLKVYIYWFLRTQTESLRALNQGAAQPNLNTGIVKAICVPIPPRDEVCAISNLLDRMIQAANLQEGSIEHCMKQAIAQRKSLLKAAFCGQLVPQNPNEDPASELLARIRAARDIKDGGSIAGKRGRMPKVAP